MITPTQMYWLTRLDHLHTFFCTSYWICVGFVILSLLGFFVSLDSETYLDMRFRKIIQYFVIPPVLVVGLLFMLAAALTPRTKEVAAIMVIPRVVNSEKMQTVGNRLYDLAVEWMDELKPRKDGAEEVK